MISEAWNDVLLRNCRPELPKSVCWFANLCGLFHAMISFFVLLPQILYNFRRGSIEGLSFVWAAANFTASLNDSFFVFKWGTLPLYSQIQAIYMPIVEAIILLQFFFYVQHSRNKQWIILFCLTVWTIIVSLQSFLIVYHWLEWLSIALWSFETLPQVEFCKI